MKLLKNQIRPSILRLSAGLAAVLLLCAAAPAGEKAPVKPAPVKPLYESASGSGKTGYVNMASILRLCKQADPIISQLHAEADKKKAGRVEILKQITELRMKASKDALAAKSQELKDYDVKSLAYLGRKQNELFAPLFDKIESEIRKYGEKNKFSAIYPFAQPKAEDVTKDILDAVNRA